MKQASVGFHCPECVKGGKQQVFNGPPVFNPIVTKVLIGINVLAFLVSSGARYARLDFGLIALGFDLDRGKIIGVAEGEYYRLVTSGFMHADLLHLALNMYVLWVLGPQLERVFDRPRFIALYTASMFGGAAGVMLLQPDGLTVGASGAIFGLFGAVAIIQRAMGMNLWSSGIGPVLAINLGFTFLIPQISVGGHLGGLIGGALIGSVYVWASRRQQPAWTALVATGALGAVFVIAAIVLAHNPVV